MKKQLFKYKRGILLSLLCASLLGIFSSTAWAQPDLMIRDDPNDNGTEPNPNNVQMYVSPDIWITHLPNGPTQMKILYGQTNYVHVRVRNRGNATSYGNEELHLYWAQGSTLLYWPAHWYNYVATYPGCTAHVYGHELNSTTVSPIAAGNYQDIVFAWNPPNPADYSCQSDPSHFCLLARLITDSYLGMTYQEGYNVTQNTRLNNNIAWKNIAVVKPGDGDPEETGILVRNGNDVATAIRLGFSVPEAADGNIFNYATVGIKLTGTMYDRWQAGGALGENIEDQGDGTIHVLSPDAWIGGMTMDSDEMQEVILQFTRTDADYTGTMDLDLVQYQEGENMGGERFTVDFSSDASGDDSGELVSDVPDHSSLADGISVYPNPVQTEFTLSSKDRSASYSVRMLDVLGCEVYSGSFSGDLKIKVAKFPKGVYYLEMRNVQTGTQTMKRLIVN